jgi:hypothetical protein
LTEDAGIDVQKLHGHSPGINEGGRLPLVVRKMFTCPTSR